MTWWWASYLGHNAFGSLAAANDWGGRVKRLNGMDAMLLYSETPNPHTHTLKVAIVHAGDFTFDTFRETIARRLHFTGCDACQGNSRPAGSTAAGQTDGVLPPALAPKAFRLQSERADHNRIMNFAVSNVPGANQPSTGKRRCRANALSALCIAPRT